MRTIELAGPVGAGKSAVADGIRTLLTNRGCRVHTLDEFRRGRRQELAAAAWFAIRRPSLTWVALRSLAGARIPGWHRRFILSLVLRLGPRLEHARRTLPADAWLVVDEGWVQRAVNLFAWRDPPIPVPAIRRYLRLAPLSGTAIVMVSAPPGVARDRALRRGLPRRLRGADAARISGFLDRAEEVSTAAASALSAMGEAVIQVDNEGELAATVTAVATRLDEQWPSASDGVSSTETLFQPHLPTLPRPDRLAARMLARRRTAAPPQDALTEIMSRYGLAPGSRLRSTRSPGGRGASYVIETPRGELFLKRYKPNVGPEAIRGEHSILAELARRAVPAPRLHPALDGDTWIEVDGAHYAAFAYVDGYGHPHEQLMWPGDRRRFETAAGSALATLHAALAGFEPAAHNPNGFAGASGGRLRNLAWFTTRLDEIATGRGGAANPGHEEVTWVTRELPRIDGRLDAAHLPRAVIHGDYGPYNVLVFPQKPIVILDFELARVDWRLTDLAGAMRQFAQRRVGFDTGAARRFVDGYRHRSELPDSELALLPDVLAFLSLRRAVVCWTRARQDRPKRWLGEAAARVRLSRALIAGAHPLVSVVADR